MRRLVLPVLFLVASALPAQDFEPQVRAFAEALDALGVEVGTPDEAGHVAGVRFSRGEGLPAEGYRVTVGAAGVEVLAADTAAAAYAAADLLRRARIAEGQVRWPEETWETAPAFAYRSFMVDMGRNPHSPETLRHVVDMMWWARGNYLQLHLTDDQLISWPSTAYPELQSEAAGWTLEDFRALEAYSQARGVTIVPELDVPGHSTLLRRRLPEVFGETPLDLATSATAQEGVETLIAEMLAVFQASPYMHVGADEVHGVPQELQRAFINRLDAFIRAQGRTTLAWEGPGRGGGEDRVATSVIHMAWEGSYYPLPELVEDGYRVINASWDPFYVVDHYPRNNFTGVPLDRIYDADLRQLRNVDPRHRSFHEPQRLADTSRVLGFCMPWWEGREENLLPLCQPRFAAAAARAWMGEDRPSFEAYLEGETDLLPRLQAISGFTLPPMPRADSAAARAAGNLAFGATVRPSTGAHQPHFGPARLTNGITDRFDLFLGYPAEPEPLVLDLELTEPATAGRIRVHEIAVGGSWEKYRLSVSADGEEFVRVGETVKGDRGDATWVDHVFMPQRVQLIRLETDGCEDFTFPSFSRLSEVEAFAE